MTAEYTDNQWQAIVAAVRNMRRELTSDDRRALEAARLTYFANLADHRNWQAVAAKSRALQEAIDGFVRGAGFNPFSEFGPALVAITDTAEKGAQFLKREGRSDGIETRRQRQFIGAALYVWRECGGEIDLSKATKRFLECVSAEMGFEKDDLKNRTRDWKACDPKGLIFPYHDSTRCKKAL